MSSLSPGSLLCIRRQAETAAAKWIARARPPDGAPSADALLRLAHEGRALIGAAYAALFIFPEEEGFDMPGGDTVFCRLYLDDPATPPQCALLRFVSLAPFGLDPFRETAPFWGAVRSDSTPLADFAWSVKPVARAELLGLFKRTDPLATFALGRRSFRLVSLAESARPAALAYAVRRARSGGVFRLGENLFAALETSSLDDRRGP